MDLVVSLETVVHVPSRHPETMKWRVGWAERQLSPPKLFEAAGEIYSQVIVIVPLNCEPLVPIFGNKSR